MRYRNDFMPITCGSYNGGMPASFSQGTFQPQPQSGMVMGAPQPAMVVQQPLPSMPTGFPTGGTAIPLLPTPAGLPSTVAIPGVPAAAQVPVTVESTLYTPGFLRTQIGKRMKVEFLVGTNGMTDRIGTLVAVGASYIILRLYESDDLMMCDIYSIKFVTIYL